jgi:Ni,Fe-hydrogenase I large subunit
MSVKTYGLQDIKKELQFLDNGQLIELCQRLARYKKENKELLAYLLFDANNEQAFIESVIAENGFMFSQLPSNSYQMAKTLRKILRLLNKYVKFMGSKEAEIQFLISFCRNYIQYADRRGSYKPLRLILTRQLEKVKKAIEKLHEDLQFDYSQDYNAVLDEAEAQLKWFYKNEYQM